MRKKKFLFGRSMRPQTCGDSQSRVSMALSPTTQGCSVELWWNKYSAVLAVLEATMRMIRAGFLARLKSAVLRNDAFNIVGRHTRGLQQGDATARRPKRHLRYTSETLFSYRLGTAPNGCWRSYSRSPQGL